MSKVQFNITPPQSVLNQFGDPYEDIIEAAGDLLVEALKSPRDSSPWASRQYDAVSEANKASAALHKAINRRAWKDGDHKLLITVDGATLYFCAVKSSGRRTVRPRSSTARSERTERTNEEPEHSKESAPESGGERKSVCKTCHKTFTNRFALGRHYQENPSHRD